MTPEYLLRQRKRYPSLAPDELTGWQAQLPENGAEGDMPTYAPIEDTIGNSRRQTPLNEELLSTQTRPRIVAPIEPEVPQQIGNGLTADVVQPSTYPSIENENTGTLNGTVHNPTADEEYQMKRQAYLDANAAPAHKQGKWAQGGFMGFQALEKFGKALAGQQDDKPIEWLGNAKKAKRVEEARSRYAPLEAQRQSDIKTEGAILQNQERTANIFDTLSKPQREYAEQQNRIQLQQMKDEAEGKKWTPLVINGKIFKKFGNGNTEPLFKKDGTQEVELTKVPVDRGGRMMTGYEAGRLDVDEGQFNARQTQDVDKENAQRAWQTQKENVSNQLKYNDDVRSVLMKMAEANQAILSANPEAGTALQNMQGFRDEMDAYAQEIDRAITEEEKKAAQDGFDGAQKRFYEAQKNLVSSLGKQQGAQKLASEMNTALKQIKPPARITYKPIKASTVNTGKPVPKSKDPLGILQ